GERIARSCTLEDLAEAERDLAGEIRDHPTHMMRDDLQTRQLIEQPRIDEPCQAGCGLIRPAEAEPDFVFGSLFACIVSKLRPAHGMNPDRQVMPGHTTEYRPEFRPAQRLASHICENLDAACP